MKNGNRAAPRLKTTLLFIAKALAEIIGCFLPYVWLCKGLGRLGCCFASGRVYAAYGGVYVSTALVWLRVVDGG